MYFNGGVFNWNQFNAYSNANCMGFTVNNNFEYVQNVNATYFSKSIINKGKDIFEIVIQAPNCQLTDFSVSVKENKIGVFCCKNAPTKFMDMMFSTLCDNIIAKKFIVNGVELSEMKKEYKEGNLVITLPIKDKKNFIKELSI